jgi:hypothetical protein
VLDDLKKENTHLTDFTSAKARLNLKSAAKTFALRATPITFFAGLPSRLPTLSFLPYSIEK